MSLDLTDLLNGGHAAARVLDERGWTQRALEDDRGRVCAEGAALRACSVPGDGFLLRQVVIHRWDAGADFNDASGRTAAEVRAALDRDVTEHDLAETFGPQWESIVALVRRAAVLTNDEAERLRATWDATRGATRGAARGATWDAAWDATWDAARDATGGATWSATWSAAWDATWGAAWDATGGATWDAARDTTGALVVRDLIGQYGFTADYYRTLTGPWARVIGPAHPDDEKDGLL